MPLLLAFIFIGICVAVLAWLIPSQDVPLSIWSFVFIALSACAKYSWAHPKAPKNPSSWLMYIGVAAAAGLFVAVIDAVFYGLDSGHVIMDMSVAVLGAILAIAGSVRSFLLGEKNDV